MSRSRLSVLAVLVLFGSIAISGAAGASDTLSIAWEAGTKAGDRALVLRFPAAPPAFSASVSLSALVVGVHGVAVPETLPPEIRAVRDGARTLLVVERQGLRLRGVRIDGAAVVIEVGDPPSEATGSAAYKIGVGDTLTISVYKNADLSGEFAVTPEGTISMHLLGPVAAAGKTEAALAEELTRRLASDYLVDPQVSVSVRSYQSQFVHVTGAVQRSARIAIRPGITLRGVLSEAGVALLPGMTVELRRGTGESSTLDAEGLDSVSPRDGDVLTVLEPKHVTIYGEVRRANRLVLVPGMTLLNAIAMAEGLTDWANKKEVRIRRKGPSGQEEISVNLRDIEEGDAKDPVLKPDDVIIVKRRIL